MGTEFEGWWDVHAHVEVPGSETAEDVATRVVPAFEELLERLGEGETAVVVTHGASLRIALAGILDWPLSTAGGFESMQNCGWAVLAETGAAGSGWRRTTPPSRPRTPISNRPTASIRFPALPKGRWGCGAVGSALAWHARGQGFESPQLHKS